MKRVILKTTQSPGDVVMLTAAVRACGGGRAAVFYAFAGWVPSTRIRAE